ncbi:hypothetical protein TNIN_69461 [Trichonephila inaurata madagascariensis]|uniref:Uncharacterized protein n=1 Tax=Trichonephila inaurata madagascariensis TaxID=2747483 RepID=A0A8X6XZR4_9ARAC|nr:hypothetical protein TNIN_69461 [Trichonephila inaurata madagascariensis]
MSNGECSRLLYDIYSKDSLIVVPQAMNIPESNSNVDRERGPFIHEVAANNNCQVIKWALQILSKGHHKRKGPKGNCPGEKKGDAKELHEKMDTSMFSTSQTLSMWLEGY